MPLLVVAMNNAPIQELPVNEWSASWRIWFALVVQSLGGWNKTRTHAADFNFGSVPAQGQTSATATVKGVNQGDAVTVAPLADKSGIIFSGVVTAKDTVTVYAKNFTAAAINPVSATIRLIIFQN